MTLMIKIQEAIIEKTLIKGKLTNMTDKYDKWK